MDGLRVLFDPYGDPCEHGQPRHPVADDGIGSGNLRVGSRRGQVVDAERTVS